MKPVLTCLLVSASAFVAGWFSASNPVGGFRREITPTNENREQESLPLISSSRGSQALETELDSVDHCMAVIRDANDSTGNEHPLLLAAIRSRALHRWLELDAEHALSFAEADVRTSYQPGIAEELFRVWLDLNVESALSAFAQASPALVEAVRTSFFSNLAQIDPERAVKELSDPRWESSRRLWDSTAARVFAVWAANDPVKAYEAAWFWKEDRDYANPLYAVAEVWGSNDPVAAWQRFKSADKDGNARALLAGYLLEQNPDADLGGFREQARKAIAYEWGNRNPESALEFARSLMPEDEDGLGALLIERAANQLATAEPRRVIDLLHEIENSAKEWEIRGIVRPAFVSLAAGGLEESLTIWADLPVSHKNDALAGIMTHQFALDQRTAVANCRQWLADPSMQAHVLPAMKVALSWGHGAGAHDLGLVVEEIPELREHVVDYLLHGWVKTDPEEAAEFIARRVTEKGGEDLGEQEAVAELAFSRPEFTARWLSDLPEGAFQLNAAIALTANWTRFNPDAAAEWIATLPDGKLKDAVARVFEEERR